MSQQNQNAILLPDNCKDIYSFEKIVALSETMYMQHVAAIDLSQVTFIEPYSMVNLLLIGKNYLQKTGSRLLLLNIPVTIHQYLARMDFQEQGMFDIPEQLDPSLLLKRSSFSRRVIEITPIPNKERESIKVISSIIKIFRKRASYILKFWLEKRVIDYFVTVISEICQNVFEHSLDSGYLSIQTYDVGSHHLVRLVIVDSGVGIEGSFTDRKAIRYNSTAELLQLTLTTPISSKRDFGYGLCQVNSIVRKLQGNLFVRSGNASVAMVYNKKKENQMYSFLKNDLTFFPGTQISISLIA